MTVMRCRLSGLPGVLIGLNSAISSIWPSAYLFRALQRVYLDCSHTCMQTAPMAYLTSVQDLVTSVRKTL